MPNLIIDITFRNYGVFLELKITPGEAETVGYFRNNPK